MPKKGEKQPYRVRYQYSNDTKGVIPTGSLWLAEDHAGAIARRGGTATVVRVTGEGRNKTEQQISRFEPGFEHVIISADGAKRFTCTCGREGGDEMYDDGNSHQIAGRGLPAEDE
jgi:hypothetical protein